MEPRNYNVYILSNQSNRVLYTGVTNNLERRLYEHKNKLIDGFTKKYNCSKRVWYEMTESIEVAITREKRIRAGSRDKKIKLIESTNSDWRDLSLDWSKVVIFKNAEIASLPLAMTERCHYSGLHAQSPSGQQSCSKLFLTIFVRV